MPYLINAVFDYNVLVRDKREPSQCVTVKPQLVCLTGFSTHFKFSVVRNDARQDACDTACCRNL